MDVVCQCHEGLFLYLEIIYCQASMNLGLRDSKSLNVRAKISQPWQSKTFSFSPTLALLEHPSSYSIFSIVTNFFDRLEIPERDGNDISATGCPSYFTITVPFNPDLTMYSVDEMDNPSGTGRCLPSFLKIVEASQADK